MFKVEKVIDARGQTLIQDPPIARFFFQSTITAWLWLAVRLYVGYDFLIAGWHKFNTPAWMDGSGTGILGFWKGALAWVSAKNFCHNKVLETSFTTRLRLSR